MNDRNEAEFLLRLILTTHGAISLPGDENFTLEPEGMWNKRIVVSYEQDPARYTIYLEENTE
ncbi:hypothetical protein HUN41_00083 [Streptomyces phage Coruscant]|uniref:Uncharacterized protein n=1 Tax=Streptomyces phage Coruscant TaxID=2739834 RepID=A0A7G4AW22_9CAUD|nr:hypothetical protein PP454_gp205 [Streptomyces phage Coruscant]QMP84212.1 hypothetical protein HUN41_00083 [Streptomyces phage Coruscant]